MGGELGPNVIRRIIVLFVVVWLSGCASVMIDGRSETNHDLLEFLMRREKGRLIREEQIKEWKEKNGPPKPVTDFEKWVRQCRGMGVNTV